MEQAVVCPVGAVYNGRQLMTMDRELAACKWPYYLSTVGPPLNAAVAAACAASIVFRSNLSVRYTDSHVPEKPPDKPRSFSLSGVVKN